VTGLPRGFANRSQGRVRVLCVTGLPRTLTGARKDAGLLCMQIFSTRHCEHRKGVYLLLTQPPQPSSLRATEDRTAAHYMPTLVIANARRACGDPEKTTQLLKNWIGFLLATHHECERRDVCVTGLPRRLRRLARTGEGFVHEWISAASETPRKDG
jgi:hypothetical protein